MSMTWVTHDVGIIGFHTKKDAAMKHPGMRYERCHTRFFKFWLALDAHSTDDNGTVLTPDNRRLPVVWGWSEKGCLIGLRGMPVYGDLEPYWRAIMARAVETGLELATYRQ